ncbi:MAG: CgeB family protein [Bauldia sp.]
MGDRLIIVGQAGGSNVGASLFRAAALVGALDRAVFSDIGEANGGPALLRALAWRLFDRRPQRQGQYIRSLIETCRRERARYLIATGPSLTKGSLIALKSLGVTTLNYSTDDPWNPSVKSKWHLNALPYYDVVATPRRNVADFLVIGCKRVHVVPFAFDETLITVREPLSAGPDVLFVGGADADRVAFVARFSARMPISVVGGYWSRADIADVVNLGHRSTEDVAALTKAARVNLCLVRRANRDGHVMRTYEMAATGAAMVVEDTPDHRALFGPEGEAVLYFRTPEEAAAKARALLADEALRLRLRTAAQRRVVSGGNTYRDRLATMLASLADVAASRGSAP